MSRNWVDMDSPRSPLSPPIPYRQPSYSYAQRRGSLSPPNGAFPFKPAEANPPAPAVAPPATEAEDDGGWGADADPAATVAYEKRMRKIKEKQGWTPGRPAPGISQNFNQPPRQFQPAPPYQQPPRFQQFQPPPSQPAPAEHVRPAPQSEERPVPTPAQAQPQTVGTAQVQDDRSTTTFPTSASPAPSSRSNRSGRQLNAAAFRHIHEFLGTSDPRSSTTAVEPPPAPAAAPPVDEPTPEADAPLGKPYNGPVDNRHMPHGRHVEMNDPNRAVLTNPKKWGQPAVKADIPVKAPQKAAITPAETYAQAAAREAPSDGGWGDEPHPPIPVNEDGTPMVTPVPEEEEGPEEVTQEVSDGGWGEDAAPPEPPAPIEQELARPTTPRVDGAAKLASGGDWEQDAAEPDAPEDIGPDGGWVVNPRVRSWVRSTTPVAEAPPKPKPVEEPAPGAPLRPVDLYTQALEVDAEAHAYVTRGIPPHESASGSSEFGSLYHPDDQSRRDFGAVDYPDPRRQTRTGLPYIRSEYKWKRDPHPAFNPMFFNSRLLVKFPFPIRMEAMRATMVDHFSKYGTIRVTWNHEPRSPETAEQVVLIFDKDEAIEACFADPAHATCHVRSGARSDVVPVKITVTRAPMLLTAKTVFVKIIGQRTSDGAAVSDPGNLPAVVHIDAVPTIKRGQNKIEWWARVRAQGSHLHDVASRSSAETGMKAEHIVTLDLGPHIPEKELVTNLVNYFGEVVDVIQQPTGQGGWLIVASSQAAGRSLMIELGRIPGILSRWASPLEELRVRQTLEGGSGDKEQSNQEQVPAQQERGQYGSSAAAANKEDASAERPAPPTIGDTPNWARSPPTSPVVARSQPPPVSPYVARPPPRSPIIVKQPLYAQQAHILSPQARKAIPIPQQPKSLPPKPTEAAAPALPPPAPAPAPATLPITSIPSVGSSQLVKRLVPTYRGRTLREEASGATPKYFDDAAVFVSNLVKGSETESSLFQRFSRYGTVCGVDLRTRGGHGEHTSAKILYKSKAAADRAMRFEQGAISFGSTISLEKRRVLASDVELEEKFIDDWGRAYSPSLAPQYSPPQLPLEDDGSFIQPPPLITAAPAAPMFWAPLPGGTGDGVETNPNQPIIYALCAYYPPPGQAGAPAPPKGPSTAEAAHPPTTIPIAVPFTKSIPAPSEAVDSHKPEPAVVASAAATSPLSLPKHQLTLLSQLNGVNGHHAPAQNGIAHEEVTSETDESAAAPSVASSAEQHVVPAQSVEDYYADEAPELFDHQPEAGAPISFNPPPNDSRTTYAAFSPTVAQARPFVPSYQYQQQYQHHQHYQDGVNGDDQAHGGGGQEYVNGHNGSGGVNGYGFQHFSQDAGLQDGRWQHSYSGGGADDGGFGNGYGQSYAVPPGGYGGRSDGWVSRGGRGVRGGRGFGRRQY